MHALHKLFFGGFLMPKRYYSKRLFYKYYASWIKLYKEQAVRPVTLNKYYLTLRQLQELAPDLHLNELNRQSYQQLLNDYAKTHEKQTTLDFHHLVKAAIVDALDDGLIEHDPTRRAIIKGRKAHPKKSKFLNLYELQLLLRHLNLPNEINWDWFILLVAKSVMVDWQLMNQIKTLIDGKDEHWPIFVPKGKRVFNSTTNKLLEKYCTQLGIPVISIHGLRHTHASLLLYEGVSVASVAKRLGHANTTTTQMTYLHIIKELENKDNDKILHHLSQLR